MHQGRVVGHLGLVLVMYSRNFNRVCECKIPNSFFDPVFSEKSFFFQVGFGASVVPLTSVFKDFHFNSGTDKCKFNYTGFSFPANKNESNDFLCSFQVFLSGPVWVTLSVSFCSYHSSRSISNYYYQKVILFLDASSHHYQ